jgi:hypothetical protein
VQLLLQGGECRGPGLLPHMQPPHAAASVSSTKGGPAASVVGCL